jgi:putative ABC transport system ATP-binding protein
VSPLLSMRAVTRAYPGPPEVIALTDVDLTMNAGEYCAITGPSGSGKSTLLNLLGLLDRSTGGRYEVSGQDVTGMRAGEVDRLRSTTFGFVFQSAHMVSRWSVAANVSLGLRAQHFPRRDRPAAVREALELVGLRHRAQGRAVDLSGGERQRAAIARAVCTRPAVLLADEPTGNLDSRNAEGVLNLFDRIHAEGVTVVVITHDESVAARAGRRITVHDGQVRGGVHVPVAGGVE